VAEGKWQYPKSKSTPGKVCKDCRDEGITKVRPAPHPGPRCYSHYVQRKRAVRLANRGRRVNAVYSITAEKYAALLEFQGGTCAICRRANGTRKRLAVDHDHSCCAGPTSCGRCVRGLLCGPCNDVLAHFRDDAGAGIRIAQYLTSWPRRRLENNLPWPPAGMS
jgi:hypothetical protein